MIDPYSGGVVGVSEDFASTTSNLTRFDVGLGVLAYTERFYIGGSFKHLTRPDVTFTALGDNDNRLFMRSSFHVGNVFYVGEEKFRRSRLYVSPNVLYINQGKFNQIMGGVNVGKGLLYGGAYFRHAFQNSSAFIALMGVRKGIVQVGYSYDFNIAKINTAAGAHELSLILDFGNTSDAKAYEQRRKWAECPAIFRQ